MSIFTSARALILAIALVFVTPCGASSQACPTEIGSKDGDVPFGATVCSPDKKLQAKETDPRNMGRILILDAKGATLRQIQVGEVANPLKGLAFSPDSRWLACMYHHDGPNANYIALYDMATGVLKVRIPVAEPYNHMRFNTDGKTITARTKDGRTHQVVIP